jgi:hypothetical protein
MCAIFPSLTVRKRTGKPAFLTIPDSESETPRIHVLGHVLVLLPVAGESNAFRIHSELGWAARRIASLTRFAQILASLNRCLQQ